MKFIDVVDLTQSAVSQLLGDEYMEKTGEFSGLDSYKLADVGKDVLDSGSVDSYVKSLLSQLGKMYIESRRYESEIKNLFVDSFDWGGYVERIYFSPQDIIQDDMYDLVNGQTYEDHKFYQPNVSAKIFEEAKNIVVPISLTEDQVKMAFNNWEQMNSFLSGIQANVQNTIDLAIDGYAHMLVACGIAVSDKAINTSVHLLTEAIDKGILPTGTTSEKAMNSEAFLVYALRRIAEVESQMHRYTSVFNNGNIPMQAKDVRKIMLNDFTKSCKFNVRANTYNLEEIGIGSYDDVCAWQSVNDGANKFDFATNSAISIKADSTNKLGIGTEAVEISNVIGIAFDRMAMGISLTKIKTTSNYTGSADFWNQWTHVLTNYILDTNYPIVAFIVD